MADYGMSVTLSTNSADTVARTRAALAEQGFGILTEIDVAATLKTKLDADIDLFVILGACNPPLAHRAVTADPSIGLLLPCNVVVRSIDEGHTLVQAVDPRMMVEVSGDSRLADVAEEAREKLGAALEALSETLVTV